MSVSFLNAQPATRILTTGSDCSTKNLESKFGFGKAKHGAGGSTWTQTAELFGFRWRAQHPAAHPSTWALRSRLPGNEARSDDDSAAALQSKA
jgi:hypothetical protein